MKIGLVLSLVMLLAVLFDSSVFGGNFRFYSKWVECGQKPLRDSGYPGGGVRFYEPAPSFQPIFRGGTHEKYFCTPLEAEQAGVSANPDTYEFPNLDQSKE